MLAIFTILSVYPDKPPVAVHNVSVTVLPQVGLVSISWLPPPHPSHIDHYILEYGFLQRIGSIKPEARINISEVRRSTVDHVTSCHCSL